MQFTLEFAIGFITTLLIIKAFITFLTVKGPITTKKRPYNYFTVIKFYSKYQIVPYQNY